MAGGSRFKITVPMGELNQIPGWLETGQRRTLEVGSKRIAEAIGKAAPHASGKLEASWQAETLTSTKAVVHSRSKYARKVDQGAYVTPHGKALRFRGEFRKWVRFAPHPYVKTGLRRRGSIMRAAFAEQMGHLG